MKLRLIIIAAAVTSLSACATVDLADVGATGTSAQAAKVERNVVQRAATKLYAAFSSKGWSSQASKKRVQSTASVLLKGLEKKDIQSSHGYADKNHSIETVRADMRLAAQHVTQTTKAAEVYLAMAPAQDSLREELASLERALLISRQAQITFDRALTFSNAADAPEADSFKISVDALRDITDTYGVRVREEMSGKALADS